MQTRGPRHLRSLSRAPQLAQSGLEIKLNAIEGVTERLLLFHQQIPWKTYVPPGGAPDTGNGGGDVGNGGGFPGF